MKFSVIIPIYNVEKHLPQCVDSVLSQNFSDYEIILVNDGSPDNCGKICDEYKQKYSQIKVIHKENGGLSDARNFGIKQAQGEYLMFLDSDDYWQGDNLFFDLDNIIEQEKPDVILHSFTYDNQETLRKDNSHFNVFLDKINGVKTSQNDIETYKTELVTTGLYESTGWNKIIKNTFIKKHNLQFPFGKLHEDVFWSFDVLKHFKSISFYKSDFYQYRIGRKGAITQKMKPKNVLDIGDFVLKNVNENNTDALNIYILQMYFAIYGRFFMLSKNDRNALKENLKQYDAATEQILKKYSFAIGKKKYLIDIFGVYNAYFLINIINRFR